MNTRRALLHWAAATAGSAALTQARVQAASLPVPRAITWPAQIELLDGRRLDSSQLSTHPAVVVFWSSTCPFCKRQNEHVEKLQRSAAGTDLLVLGVSIDKRLEQTVEHVRREGYSFPITRQAALLAPIFDTRASIPRSFAVERGARLVSAVVGEMFEEDVMQWLDLARLG